MSSTRDLYAAHTYYSRKSLRYYLDNVVINSSPEPMAWKLVREPWQTDQILAPKLPAFEYLAGLRDKYDGPRSFMDILARGHDKSSLEGRLATGLLLCSKRPITGYIIASDLDQGKLLVEAMQMEASLNQWVESQIRFVRDKVVGPAGTFEVVPADAGGAFGYRGNCFIFDEFTNWTKPVSKKVWQAVMSGREKVQPNLAVVISNAGFLGSWQHQIYENWKTSKDARVFDPPGQLASWMPRERVDALRANLPPSEARRVFDNVWINPGEDNDYLTLEDARRCVEPSLCYRLRRQPGIKNYVASIDYGPRRDRTCAFVGHIDPSGRLILDRGDVWEGKSQPDGIVQPSVIRRWIEDVVKGFDPQEIVIDPAGMLSEIEWMRIKRLPVYEYAPRGGAGNVAIAQALRTMILGNAVRWYLGFADLPGSTFEDELARLVTKKMPYGFRIDHTSTGHDDRAVTLGQLLVRSAEYPPR